MERYTDKPKKFKFETYEVEDGNKEVEKAIKNNGLIKVTFHKRIKKSLYYYNESPGITYTYYTSSCNINTLGFSSAPISTTATYSEPITTSYDTSVSAASYDTSAPIKKETGRVTEGNHSNQSFVTVDMEFNPTPYSTEIIKILPESQKPYTSEDIQKVYCQNCGRKLKTKYKYCPYCGTSVSD